MGQLVDTSVLIAMERRGLPIERIGSVAPDEDSGLSAVALSEILVGVHRAATPAERVRREAFVDWILAAFPVFPFDEKVARLHAELWARLINSGTMIGAHDLQIAATAIANGYAILTDNVRDFHRVPGLDVRVPVW